MILSAIATYCICSVVDLVSLAWAKAQGVPILWMEASCVPPVAALAFTLQRVLVFRGGRAPLNPQLSS